MNHIIKKITFFLCIVCSSLSCVGTIKDSNSLATIAKTSSKYNLNKYPGIEDAVAIADSKVEVFFPVFDAAPEDIAYVIRYSGQLVPIYISATTVKPVLRYNKEKQRVSSLKATVSGLLANTNYNFSVDVRNVKEKTESNNNVNKEVKTFANTTAQFGGIVEARNIPGAAGMTAIEVSWIDAERRGSTINKNDVDPVSYSITLIDASTPIILKSAADMNDTTIDDGSRITTTADIAVHSKIIYGLRANTKYYAQVRAIHYGKILNFNDPHYLTEENTNYAEVITYNPNAEVLVKYPESVKTTYPFGTQGLTSINLSWTPAYGVFDHYRLFFTETNASVTPTSCPNDKCRYIESSKNLYQLVGVTPNKTYYLTMVACQNTNCTTSKKYNVVTHLTSPPVITTYGGIQLVEPAKNLGTLDKFFLNMSLPDFNQGYISGVDIVGCKGFGGCDPRSPATGIAINGSVNALGLIPDPNFDYATTSVLEISGINPASSDSYCFLAKPFIFDTTNTKSYIEAPLSQVKCKVPEIKAPSFSGLDSISSCELLTWSIPTTGVFDAFEIYYRRKDSAFDLPYALNDPAANYQTVIVGPDTTSFSTLQLALDGMNYDFGIRTLYRSSDGVSSWLRSDNVSTDKILKCPQD